MVAHFIAYTQNVPHIDPAHFLRVARGRERFYWEHNDEIYAGFGIAAEFTAWGENRFQSIQEKIASLINNMELLGDDTAYVVPRLFGGFSFRSDFITENTWAAFAPAYFVLPHYQLTRMDGLTYLTLSVQVDEGETIDAAEILAEMKAALTSMHEMLHDSAEDDPPILDNLPIKIDYPLSAGAWSDMITDATLRMKADELQKVVLARVCELRFEDRVDVDSALGYLREKYAGCYLFLFEPTPYLAFYGATPELLVRVEDREIETMALAGSIRRGATPAEDAALANELLADPKNRQEHAFVADALRDRLTPLTTVLNIPEMPEILRLKNIQHLHTPVHGRLKEPLGVLPLVEALHPTPAMGGVPQAKAMDYIAHAEPVPRGWYASPVGWIDHNLDGAFAVAIRSAISQNERVWLYAGAGIVADSIPGKEWDETALKFKPMLGALGVDAYVRA
jgi:menaquinone-specific isochorismate synthase